MPKKARHENTGPYQGAEISEQAETGISGDEPGEASAPPIDMEMELEEVPVEPATAEEGQEDLTQDRTEVDEMEVDEAIRPQTNYRVDISKDDIEAHKALTISSIRTSMRRPLCAPRPKLSDEEIGLIDGLVRRTKEKQRKISLAYFNAALYAAVTVVLRKRKNKARKPYILTLQERRKEILSEISVLDTERDKRNRGLPRPLKWRRRAEPTLQKYQCKTLPDIEVAIRTLKDRLATTQEGIKVETMGINRRHTRRQGCKALLRDNSEVGEIPLNRIREFWGGIIGEEGDFDPTKLDFVRQEQSHENYKPDGETWKKIFKKLKPWRAPGPDGIRAGYWRDIPIAKDYLTQWCTKTIEENSYVPAWLCRGKVFLLPKEGDRADPGNYRPITCLNTCYKILTSAVAEGVKHQVGDLMPETQLAMTPGIRGCTHAHLIDQYIVQDALRKNKALAMFWVDMRKAYDSLNHRAILWMLNQLGVSENLKLTIKNTMERYEVRYSAFKEGKIEYSEPLKVKNGIMQGDTLSPLLFCLTIRALSQWLNLRVQPYTVNRIQGTKYNHLMYMDDIKIYTDSTNSMEAAITGLPKISEALGLKLNRKKCALKFLNCTQEDISSLLKYEIPVINEDHYKYLGVEQNLLPCGITTWERVASGCVKTTANILDSELTVHQMVTGYNQTIIPRVRFIAGCGIITYGKYESHKKHARDIDMDIRKLLVQKKLREAHSSNARLYCETKDGGLGMMKCEDAVEDATIQTYAYLVYRSDLDHILAQAVRQANRGKRTVHSDATKVLRDYNIKVEVTSNQIRVAGMTHETARQASQEIIKLMNKQRKSQNMQEWLNTACSARTIIFAKENPELMSNRDSNLWITKGFIGTKATRMIMGLQEGTTVTNYSVRSNRRENCRYQCPYPETGEHIVSGCAKWRHSLMINRHDDIVEFIMLRILDKSGLRKIEGSRVYENDRFLVYNDTPIHVRNQVGHNKPDILWIEKASKKAFMIEVSVSWYTRLVNQEKRKTNKYTVNGNLPEDTPVDSYTPGRNLVKELKEDRGIECEFIPLVIGASGEVSPNFRRYLARLGLPDSLEWMMERMQRHAVLGSNRILLNHLSLKTQLPNQAE